ncbi:FolC bifunctional protein [Laetiporus sulphureus 93-53]|uniref:Folylpolyglutamate synthase n=1 Tax=Laetiporus sulphureus 93-53 TaxID=1314785 RepID=A0A165I9L7_9APHY|nr:FolC bifunctional protein [Laetiporus sulphureus 93-53]KZT12772.1 FolC bifunctional protein [Laetiporus sulphureus 93-53]
MSTRSYKDAIDHLNSLQSNAAALEAVRASGGRLSELAIPEMVEYLNRIGYSTSDLNRLNVIHITGTKGKGSTSAFTDSIIRHAMPQWKVGLYTSPHLIAVRERIRINGVPIPEEQFATFFFDVWDRLEENDTRALPQTSKMPGYFRFVTLVAYHAFLTLKVDATVLEVGVGGMYDSTNIVPKPIVTGISALGIDHTAVLGKTLKEIAWQKGGIYKEGVPALTVDQPEEGIEVLRQQADDRKASEFIVAQPTPGLSEVKLGLAGSHQYQNANLAVHLAKKFLQAKGVVESENGLPESFVEGLQRTKWPGRCQTVPDPKHSTLTWFLDGAHTKESLECCMQWFVSPDVALRHPPTSQQPRRVLVFNCTNGRSGKALLGTMIDKTATQLKLYGRQDGLNMFYDHVIFCTNVTYADGGFKGDLTTFAIPTDDLAHLQTQHDLATAWSSLLFAFPSDHVHVLPSVEHAIKLVYNLRAESAERQTDVLVSGSLHLVGGVIEVAGLSQVAL